LAKKKIFRSSVFNENVIGTDFGNIPSSSIFRLGSFTLDTNLDGRFIRDFSNKITTFSKEYTLHNIGISESNSEKLYKHQNTLKLNLNYNEITAYSRYGSVEDLFKFNVKNILEKFPYSLYVTNTLNSGIANTIINFTYDEILDISKFKIPTITIINQYGIIVDSNNFNINVDKPLLNFNLNQEKYVIWSSDNENIEYPIIGFNGNSTIDSFIEITVKGKLFNLNNSTLSKTYHIKPSSSVFKEFLSDLNDIERYFLKNKTNLGYMFMLKEINDDGRSFYNRNFIWPASDGYNINFDGVLYNSFISDLINLGIKYDEFKTDTIYRHYTTESLKEFDTTNDQKIKKLIRSYGFEFDKIRRLTDGFATLNNLTYKKENSVPDILIKNVARVLGWDVFDIIEEEDLLNNIFGINNNISSDTLIPSEINIELWRRILVNTKWFFKSKGTRKSIETIFKMIGIPEQFILFNEYVYIAENQLQLNERKLSIIKNDNFDDLDIINESSFNSDGYPIAVRETNDFFFQISGNTDSGQAYINRFRENGFSIEEIIDNKKSWVDIDENTERIDENTQYSLEDSKLLINTKEIDIGFSPSNALEYDLFEYNRTSNYPICSTGVTSSVFYINSQLNVNQTEQTVFEIPDIPEGDISISINGITLTIDDDYTIGGPNNNIVTLLEPALNNFNNIQDIVSITYITDYFSQTNNYVEYVIIKVGITSDNQAIITLPEEPLGDVQFVVNGITLRNSKLNNDGDFYINPLNRNELIITSEDISSGLLISDTVTIMYLKEINLDSIEKYSDSHKITSFFNNKLYFNNIINRYVYITDYSIINQEGIKITLNGITLTNGNDFILNPINKTQIIFAPGVVLKINDTINAFYIINNDPNLNCIPIHIDVNNSTFLDYIQAVLTELINVKNRKIITDNNGGIYPKLSLIYDLYLNASNVSGIFNSNGYQYSSLYNYMKNFDTHFTKFLFQLLPATTIIRKAGLIVSNPIFGLQKYRYIRGINDGSEFTGSSTKLVCDLFDFNVITTPATTTENLGIINIESIGFNGFTEYSIDNGEIYYTTNEFTGLLPGLYDIKLRDEIGCVVTGTTEIIVDCSLFELIDIIPNDVISINDLGSIEIIASGDTNIFYSIDNGNTFNTNNIFTNLSAGNYNILIKNSLDCILTGSTVINLDCENISIEDFTIGICNPIGFLNRDNSSLTVVNNILVLSMSYTFTIDTMFNRYFREKIIITETTTSHILLEKFVDFIVEPNQSVVNLGIIFTYNVPTYSNFNFEVSYSDQIISCTPFVEPIPNDVFNPLQQEIQPFNTYYISTPKSIEDLDSSGCNDIYDFCVNPGLSTNTVVYANTIDTTLSQLFNVTLYSDSTLTTPFVGLGINYRYAASLTLGLNTFGSNPNSDYRLIGVDSDGFIINNDINPCDCEGDIIIP
jgi:hypothetical protein